MPLLSWKQIITLFFYVFLFIVIFSLIAHQVSGIHTLECDTLTHIKAMNEFFDGKGVMTHPVWFVMVHYLSLYGSLNDYSAACLVTAFFYIFLAYVFHGIILYFLNKEKETLLERLKTLIVILIALVVGPLYLLNTPNILLGVGSPSVWHNTTLIAVKPFAMLTFFYAVLAFEHKKLQYYSISLFMFVISMFAKLSFALVFVPALALYLLVKKNFKKESFMWFGLFLLVFIVVAVIQFMQFKGDGSSKIVFDFLGVWSLGSKNILVSIIKALFFPLLLLLLNYKRIFQNDWLLLSWIMTIISIMVFACFAESGGRYAHGNFGWSYLISLTILYFFSILEFVKSISNMHRFKKYFLGFVLFYQTLVGVFYFTRVYLTGYYL